MNGNLVPECYIRVSNILSIFQAYAYIPKEKLKKSQEIGTDIHEAIEAYFKNIFRPLPGNLSLYFESFLKWAQGEKINPLITEKRIFNNELMITGQLDLLAEINGQIVLLDFKTGSWSHPEIWKLQATFYRYLIEYSDEKNIPMPNKFLFIQLMKDGSAPILFEFAYDPKDWEVCMAAYRCYKYFNPTVY